LFSRSLTLIVRAVVPFFCVFFPSTTTGGPNWSEGVLQDQGQPAPAHHAGEPSLPDCRSPVFAHVCGDLYPTCSACAPLPHDPSCSGSCDWLLCDGFFLWCWCDRRAWALCCRT
jgi:hypothetical protein